ncbi:hypothetical protein PVK06_002336 [Gossypium arboreum]|uniref:CCHC-type domain-containing protein n=1 Tax=Gossypium arboreum TaxID=29729 RepID=A0ABR0R4Q3_GOSAR|nr:hypothetical protein PVK06_002336 [Gossypium arboreum]
MEIVIIRANVKEDREATMARFLARLNREIANVVELLYYVEVTDIVHDAIKVEKQLTKKSSIRTYANPANNSKWGQGTSKKDFLNRPKEQNNPAKFSKPVGESSKGKKVSNPNHTRDIKCFKCLGRGHITSQCPNRRTMVMNASGEIESKDEKEE